MDMTKDINIIQKCFSQDSATTCPATCQWVHGNKPAAPVDPVVNPTKPIDIPALFNKEFCHPSEVKAPIATWTMCEQKQLATDCSLQKECNWSEGKELIPDHDFCAPADITLDV